MQANQDFDTLAGSGVEVLDAARPNVPALAGPQMTVIDNESGNVTFEYRSPALMLAESQAQLTEAKALVPCIDSDSMYEEATALLQKVVGDWKTLDEDRLSSTKPLREKVDTINGEFAPAISVRKEAEQVLKQGIAAYIQRKEAERQRLQREADARAAEERRKAAAEAARVQREAEAKAAEARRKAAAEAAQAQRLADEEAARKREEAARAEAEGNAAAAATLQTEAEQIVDSAATAAQSTIEFAESEAAQVLEAGAQDAEAMNSVAAMVTAQPIAIAAPKVSGISKSTKYSAEVVDPKAFIQFVVDNWDTMNHLLTIEQGKLNTMAQNQKERFKVPGCELRTSNQISSRRR